MKRILFIGDGYAIGNNVGSLLYRTLIKSYGIDKFCYYGIGYKTKIQWPEEFLEMPKQISTLRIWPKSRITKYFRKIPLIEELFYFLRIPRIIRKVKKFAADNNVNMIIAVFRADVLSIINKIDNEQDLPLLGFISDTVEAEYTDKTLIYKYKRKEYYKGIHKAKGIFVAGESMSNYIRMNFHKSTSILRLGYESNLIRDRFIDREIKFFFSGSVYAESELEVFVKSLSIFASMYPDYKIIFITATNYSIQKLPDNIKIVNLGWMDGEKLITIMQNSHVGYIPYKFDKESLMQMSYAFPNKTGFYLSTGLPIFFHGPQYSSMVQFFNKYPCGIHCASMVESEIVTKLERIIFDKVFYNQCLLTGIEAFDNEFSLNILAQNFRTLINNCARVDSIEY